LIDPDIGRLLNLSSHDRWAVGQDIER